MNSSGSVSRWIDEMRHGSDRAAEALWDHYERRLRGAAKRWLAGIHSRVMDEDDIANAAFHSFVRRTRGGEYPGVVNRDEAWRVLVTIAVHKALNHVRDEKRLRRRPMNDGANGFAPESAASNAVDSAPPPDVEAMIADSVANLLQILPNEEMREIAMAKMAGYTNQEIAQTMDTSLTTVERRLRMIRARWQPEIDE